MRVSRDLRARAQLRTSNSSGPGKPAASKWPSPGQERSQASEAVVSQWSSQLATVRDVDDEIGRVRRPMVDRGDGRVVRDVKDLVKS